MPGAVAVVALVAHLHHLPDDRGDVDRSGGAHRHAQRRAEHVGHPAQPVDHLGAVRAVPQHLAQPLVQRAVGGRRPTPRARRRSARTTTSTARSRRPSGRPRAARGTEPARYPPRTASFAIRLGLVGGQPLEDHRADQRPAQRAGGAVPVDRRPGVQNWPGSARAPRAAGRTSTSRARTASIRSPRAALAGSRRGSASTADRAAAVPPSRSSGPVGRPEVDGRDVDGLGPQGVGEQIDAGGDHRGRCRRAGPTRLCHPATSRWFDPRRRPLRPRRPQPRWSRTPTAPARDERRRPGLAGPAGRRRCRTARPQR